MGLPSEYIERVRRDAASAQEGRTMPTPVHIKLREYAIHAAEMMKEKSNEEVKREIQAAKQTTGGIAEEMKERDRQIKDGLPTHVRRMWGNANLGFNLHERQKVERK